MTNPVGVDYAFSPHPALSALRAYGAGFVCRYLSPDPANDSNGKNLQAAELHAILSAGLAVVVVEEAAADSMKGGKGAGLAAANHAKAVTAALGLEGIPVYFACDWDASVSDQVIIDAYLDGAASVIGRERTGIYGGYWPVKRAFDAGKVTYGWQTSAWSGGLWDHRAQLRQVTSGSALAGVSVDRDEAQCPDYGQWPRPASPGVLAPVAGSNVPAVDVSLPVLQKGATGNAVRTVQALAGVRRGHDLTVDGDFGPATDALVRGVQSAARIAVDGVVGEDTWKALLLG